MEKVILITGASSGIGKEAAKHFAAKGWKVIASMRHPEREEELTGLENVLLQQLDVEDPVSIEAAIKNGIRQLGHIDVLLNNAGYGQMGIFEAMTPEQVRKQFDVNVFGVMDTIRAILPHFRARKEGMIVNISSGAGKFTLPTLSLYSASKFALEGFSEALSFELGMLNIKVKIVEPGGTETNFSKTSFDHFAVDPTVVEYKPFLDAAGQLFQSLRDQRLVTAGDVAETIFTAVTDGTDTLRYVIGNDDFKRRLQARQELPDQEYVNAMRQGLGKYLPA